MQKNEFVQLVKLYAKFGIEIRWEELLRIPNSIVSLILNSKNRQVVKLITMVLKTNEPLNEEYLKDAIQYIITCNITNQVILNTLKNQTVSIDKIRYIEITDDLMTQEIIACILLDSKVISMGIEMEAIEVILKASNPFEQNMLVEYITSPLVNDKNMLFAGINYLASATIPAKISAIFQVLVDKIGIVSGLCLKYAQLLLDCTISDDIDKILVKYEKEKAKYLNLEKSTNIGLRELSSKLGPISGIDEVTKDDIIGVICPKR